MFVKHTRSILLATLALLALSSGFATPAHAEPTGKVSQVNVNEAGADALALLPRVGPAVAARIVEFRDQNGGFETVADLMLVRGIGEKTFALLEPYVTVTGDTTLTEKVRVQRPRPAATEAGDGGRR
jgi:competence ComEA-like helix-hairpin-helix protein